MTKENKLRKLEKKRFELLRNIKLCNDYKKEVIINLSKLKESFNQGFISYEEYYRRLSISKYGEWIKYYDDSIKYNKNKLNECSKEINREERRAQIIPFISTLIILALIGLTVVVIRPEITGFTIGVEENITEISAEEISEEVIIKETIGTFIDCSSYKITDSGLYFCVDNEEIYECSEVVGLDEVERCLSPKDVRKGVTKDDCPFDYEKCNVTVNMNEGWGGKQISENEKYKLAVFNKEHYCGNGHCVIPFYFKSNVSLVGDLLFNISTADTLIENISIVNKNDKNVGSGEGISMKQYDSGYYNAIFDYVPVWSSPTGIRYILPMKFNITAFLDDKKILELDPIAAGSSNVAQDLDCQPEGVLDLASMSCNAGDIIIIGVSAQASAVTPTIVFGNEVFSVLGTIDAGAVQTWILNSTCSDGESATTLEVNSVYTEANNYDCAAVGQVFSGAIYLRLQNTVTPFVDSISTATAGTVSLTETAVSGEWAVDVYGSSATVVGANGDNTGNALSVDAGAAIAGISYCDYTNDGGGDGSCNMSWAGTVAQVLFASVLVPIPNTAPSNPTLILNSTITEQTNYTNETIACNFLCTDSVGDILTYDIDWIKDGIAQFGFTSQSCGNPSYNSPDLTDDNTTKGENWSCSVNITDNGGLPSSTIFSENITIENYAPIVGVFSNVTSTEDIGTITIITNADLNANFSDIDAVDSAPTTYEIIDQPNTTVKCYFDPDILKCDSVANQSDDNNIKFSLNDSSGAGAITDFNVTLSPVNDDPWKVGDLDNVTKAEDAVFLDNLIPSTDFIANWSDVEDTSGPATYELVESTNASTSCDFESNNWDCYTLANASGTDYYTISLNDSSGAPVIYDWQITITAVDDEPWFDLITNGTETISEDTATQDAPTNLSIYWNDVESGTWTSITVSDNSSDVSCSGSGEAIKCSTEKNYTGPFIVNINADDGTTSAYLSYEVDVTADNDAPWVDGLADITMDEDNGTSTVYTQTELNNNFRDVEDDKNPSSTAVQAQSDETAVSCSMVSNNLQCVTEANQSGFNDVTIRYTDSGSTTVDDIIRINVNTINDDPWIDGEVMINSTDGSNKTTQDLNCYFTPTDVEADTLTANVEWLNNNVSDMIFSNEAVIKDVENSFVLESENLTAGNLWSCQIIIYDQTVYSDWVNSTQLEILVDNTAPTNPTPLMNSTAAAQANYTTEDLAMNFNCDDDNGDTGMNWDITPYENGIAMDFILEGTCNDNDYASVNLEAENTTKLYNYSFSVNITDASLSSNTIFSNNVTIENSAPTINYVSLNESISPFDGEIRQFEFSFIANDLDETADLDNTKAIANVSLGTDNYLNNSCYAEGDVTGGRNYSCTIEMQYYYISGSWNYATEIKDNSEIAVQNSSELNGETWFYSELAAFNWSVSELTWNQLIPLQTNQTSTTTMILENTGNKATLNIFAKAIDLSGPSGKYIPAENFTIGNITSASSAECDYTNQSADVTPGVTPLIFVNDTNIYPVINTLSRGQGSKNNLYYCLFDVPANLQSESYATQTGTEWTIDVE